ncbi:hypothetical protein DY000_02048538 [Brassica cretica]|uniref:DUF1985 domain-containing protein n=1 Tax=Brassica cretica TaxID=69181 RepID=A0ABQ7F293_BRACR|nr:hypothetical protein DY000_02048538 [Brassica cretica]
MELMKGGMKDHAHAETLISPIDGKIQGFWDPIPVSPDTVEPTTDFAGDDKEVNYPVDAFGASLSGNFNFDLGFEVNMSCLHIFNFVEAFNLLGVELPLPHESDDMMDDVATPIIDPQEIPRGETMSKSDDKIALPKRISEPVENVLGREFKKLEDSFLAPVIKMGRRQKHMVFLRHLIHHLLLRRIDIGKKGLWFSFGEQLMRFSLREFHLATGLPCVVDKDEEEVETSATKNKKKDPWMKKNQTLNTLLNLLVKKST